MSFYIVGYLYIYIVENGVVWNVCWKEVDELFTGQTTAGQAPNSGRVKANTTVTSLFADKHYNTIQISSKLFVVANLVYGRVNT